MISDAEYFSYVFVVFPGLLWRNFYFSLLPPPFFSWACSHWKTVRVFLLLLLVCFWRDTSGYFQGLLWSLCLEITLAGLWEPYMALRIDPRSSVYKTNVLPPVLSFWLWNVFFIEITYQSLYISCLIYKLFLLQECLLFQWTFFIYSALTPLFFVSLF